MKDKKQILRDLLNDDLILGSGSLEESRKTPIYVDSDGLGIVADNVKFTSQLKLIESDHFLFTMSFELDGLYYTVGRRGEFFDPAKG